MYGISNSYIQHVQRLFLHEFATKAFCAQFKFEIKMLAHNHDHIKSETVNVNKI